MDALECIGTRRSIRRFLNVPVDWETIITIVEAGSLAPSSGNVQDWRFIVVDKKDLMKKICEHSLNQECIQNAGFLVVVCSSSVQTEMHYGLRGQRLYAIQNGAAAAENMLLAAHALGLGGIWVGAFDEEKLREVLDVPREARPQAILAFGYPDETPDHKRLKDLNRITYFNAYGATVKKIHHVLRDYSLDWEARINQAHTALERFKEKAQATTKKMREQAGSKGGSLVDKYLKDFKKKMQPKKK